MTKIMKDKNINKIIVVGLVYDWCVKETAIFAREMKDLPGSKKMTIDTTVLADMTRPSFDGKPGAPFTGFACDGDAADREGDFCLEGGGTLRAHAKVLKEYRDIGVKVVRMVERGHGHGRGSGRGDKGFLARLWQSFAGLLSRLFGA